MKNPCSVWALPMMMVVVLFWGLPVPVAGQQVEYRQLAGCLDEPAEFHRCALPKTKTFNPPRTPDGAPDFRGYWLRAGVFGTNDIEEHSPDAHDEPGAKSLVVDPADGKIPYHPWAAAKQETYFDIYNDPAALCFLPGVPKQLYTPMTNQILQTSDSVIFLNDYAHAYRVIPTDGRPHLGSNIRLSMGSSRGRWEGNTLVVDVKNQNAKTWFDHVGNFFSDAIHVVERWTMIGPDAIHYEARITDPQVYTRPWTMAFGLRRVTEPGFFNYEAACWEGQQIRRPGGRVSALKPYFRTEIPK